MGQNTDITYVRVKVVFYVFWIPAWNGKICAMCLLRLVVFTDKIPRLEAELLSVLPPLF